jgi:hypothetical protein
MRTLSSEQSKGIFRQLADVEAPAAVHTVIENHDAWVRNETVADEVTAALQIVAAGKPRSAAVMQKIAAQRRALLSLTTCLPSRLLYAG